MSRTWSEDEFRSAVATVVDEARRALLTLSEAEGFRIDRKDTELQLTFTQPAPATFTVYAQPANATVRVMASGHAYDLSWSDLRRTFVLDDEPLPALLQRLVHQHVRQL